MKGFNTAGMYHTCGRQLVYRGIDNGCHVLVCVNEKCKGISYRIPVEEGNLPFPWEELTFYLAMPKVKVYKCKGCGTTIDAQQAVKSFEELGRALCTACEGDV